MLHALSVVAHFRVFFSTELLVQCDGCLSWSWAWARLVAGLQEVQTCGMLILGFGFSSSISLAGRGLPGRYQCALCKTGHT